MKTVRIIDGNLFVQLTPTTDAVPAAQYVVKYSSDGKIMFQEFWAVPSSTATLRVRDVRTLQPIFPNPGGGGGGAGGVTTILESDVTGLVQTALVGRRVDISDLIDAEAVAEILGLSRRESVSVYQKRYPDMPRPVLDLGHGRPRLWLRPEIVRWSRERRK